MCSSPPNKCTILLGGLLQVSCIQQAVQQFFQADGADRAAPRTATAHSCCWNEQDSFTGVARQADSMLPGYGKTLPPSPSRVASWLLAAQGQVSTADSGNHTAQQPTSTGAYAQAFPNQPACLSGAKQQFWAAVWSQYYTKETPADHSPPSPATDSPT